MSRETEFHALFSDHYPAVARYVLARGYQAADADDLIAGTFEVAWRRLDSVPPGTTTLAGRPVIKLVAPKFHLRRWNRPGEDGVTYSRAPPPPQRLLSLVARHPTARLDHNRQDDIRAANGLGVSNR